jgi:hypothetical protein
MEVGIRDADGEGDQNKEDEKLNGCHFVEKLNINILLWICRVEIKKKLD